MGTYTTYGSFYKPDANELVDAETDVAQNLRKADVLCRALMEYVSTDVSSITDMIAPSDRLANSRYYKIYSNSIYGVTFDKSLFQDIVSVTDFVNLTTYLANGFNPIPGSYVAYKTTGNSTNLSICVEMEGEIRLNSYDTMTPNTTYTIGTLPSGVWPTTAHYYDCCAGNSSTNYSFGRLLVNTNGSMTFTRYGDTTSNGTTDNKISLSGVRYFLGTTA